MGNFPNKKYSIIYADPPWKYNSRANHKTRFRGGAEWWLRTTNSCYITVLDDQTGKGDYIPIPNDKALDAYRHPFAYKK